MLGRGGAPETLAGPGGGDRPDRRPPWVLIALVIVLVLGGGGAAAAVLVSGHHPAKPSAASTPTRSAPASSAPPTRSASPTPSASHTPGQGQVGVASSLSGNPQTPQIVGLLDTYFNAINARNYQTYYGLLNPAVQQQTSHSQFTNGFASTRDSRETLQGISAGPGGVTVATVTFTSHQSPANSVNGHQACTDWRIALYLQRNGNGYLIGKPPSGYRASYAAC